MTITLNSNRQKPVFSHVDIAFADLVNGVAAVAVVLPANAVITDGFIHVSTPFNSATTDVLDIGDAVTANRYGAGLNLKTAGRQAITLTGLQTVQNPGANTCLVNVKWTGTGAAPTAGVFRLALEYIVIGRAEFTTG